MVKTMGKNKKYIVWYIVWMVTFGLMGLLLASVVTYIIKVSKCHPKVFRWISVAAFTVIGIYYTYAFLFKQEYNLSLTCIWMVMAINGVLYNKKR